MNDQVRFGECRMCTGNPFPFNYILRRANSRSIE